ncbi:hypothetical protein INS49_001666 [Diaporthe citri]|uniref:uncharacterized protein n=1 Tax=Diaporthe citri TaxID=83186 RepID=UPI001C815E22|nr:uncharacterized protein INS49_001666 [Diaporthe citri]KAG6367476.1 hypothetical protein INS49_001666 [Diaporthe citri]
MGNGTNHLVNPSLSSSITNTFVGIGSSTVAVNNSKGFRIGQTVFVNRAATAKWIRDNGMADLVRDGKPQIWIGVGALIQQPRVIESISGNNITLTVPLTDALDKEYMSPYLSEYTPPPTSAEIGMEDFSITLSPTCSGVALNNETCTAPAISISPWTFDSYIRRVNIAGFNNFIEVQSNASRITISEVGIYRDQDTDNTSGYPADISIRGSQVLVQDSGQYGLASAAGFAVITQSRAPGPNAVVRHAARGTRQSLYPHHRWAHGFLADDSSAPVELVNRGTAGTGHGWAINAGVAWNVRGAARIQSPPLGVNWGIGVTGSITESNGTLVSSGTAVSPASLFDAQLARRRGMVKQRGSDLLL